jgi:hypothetical protein
LSQFINAVAPRHLQDPRAEGQRLVFLVQHPVKLQKDLCCFILGVFWLSKKPPADPQDVAIVLKTSPEIGGPMVLTFTRARL